MTPEQQLEALGLEIAEMMREYNDRKRHLIKIIDEKAVDIGNGEVMTPSCYDRVFDETEALLQKITLKVIDAYCFCIKAGIAVPDVIYVARHRLAEHQAFFDHLKRECPKTH